jgi:Fe-S oxidoreductase/nitrate reductase gamma subunit
VASIAHNGRETNNVSRPLCFCIDDIVASAAFVHSLTREARGRTKTRLYLPARLAYSDGLQNTPRIRADPFRNTRAIMQDITREIFWNIGPVTKVSMYVLAAVATGVAGYGFYRHWRFWRRGKAPAKWKLAPLGQIARHVLLQVRIARIPIAWLSHMAIFYGFIVLFIGTVIVALEDYGIFGLVGISWTGRFYTSSSFLLDLFGLGFVVALPVAMARRGGLTRVRPSSKPIDAAILWLLLVIGVTGFVTEALRIAHNFPPFEQNVSFVAWIMARGFERLGIAGESVRPWHLASWWLHMVTALGFLALIPYTKMLHVLVAPAQIAVAEPRNSGHLRSISMEEVEETGRVGASEIPDFTQQQLLSFDACTQCRRCESACPAWNTNKPLSPMKVVLDIAMNGHREGSLHGDVISAETLWSCTTCGACVHNCPVLIDQMGAIIDMRRYLVGEGQVVGSSQQALRTIAARGNPWGLPPDERDAWAAGLDVPRIEDNPTPDVLLWVGCAGSYDRRNQQVTRSLVKILKAAGVNYSILGKSETCTGDPARRLGDDFTFQAQAETNVATLNELGVKRIVTQCAHCFNTLANEYPDFGGKYEVTHHTAFIQELIDGGKVKLTSDAPSGENAGPDAFHDPCYLSRHNDGSAPPRADLAATGLPIVEPEATGCNTFCCGAGGGRMWMEEDIDKRVNLARWDQLKATGAKQVAVGCPFCMTMLDDAAKQDAESGVTVHDVAELVAARLVE